MPTRARTREVLPAPLGPMMPTAWPALSANRTLATTGFVPPGATMTTCSTSRLRAGRGSEVTSRFGAARVSASERRGVGRRAPVKARQLGMGGLIGAGARPPLVEAGALGAAGHFLRGPEEGAR